MISLQDGLVYAVEFSHRSGRDLINVAKKRTNVIPIIEDARHPHKYRMLVGMQSEWPTSGIVVGIFISIFRICMGKLSEGECFVK